MTYPCVYSFATTNISNIEKSIVGKDMNFKLLGFTLAASVFVILYMFGDAITYLKRSANLDQLLIPLLGLPGYYLFEILVPFASVALIFLSVREAYYEGVNARRKENNG